MHGKILRYSLATGIGVVTNQSKKIFELRKESWHDNRYLPTPGMLIEFRCNSSGYIMAAKASAYQAFPEDSYVKEIDFWKTETDEELLYKEQEIKALITQKIFKGTNFFTIKEIPLNVGVEKSIEKYFFQELNAINLMTKEFQNVEEPLLDYLQIKRFLNKAIDYLVFTDKNITMDIFLERLQSLNKLSYSYNHFMQNIHANPQKIFEEYFLENQLYYKATMQAVLGLEERILQLNTRIKNNVIEIKNLHGRLEAKNSKDSKSLESKLKILKQNIAKADEEVKPLEECLKQLLAIVEKFKNKHSEHFEKAFKHFYLALIQKTIKMLNICATDLDNFVWKLSMQSTPIHNTFFKQNITGSYCTMTFLWMYLQNLDKSKLNPTDKKAYESYLKYKKNYEKISLIYTNNVKLESFLKIKLMTESKFNAVIVAKTDADFFSHIHSTHFAYIYLDSSVLTPIDTLTTEIKKSSKNSQTQILTIPSKKE